MKSHKATIKGEVQVKDGKVREANKQQMKKKNSIRIKGAEKQQDHLGKFLFCHLMIQECIS